MNAINVGSNSSNTLTETVSGQGAPSEVKDKSATEPKDSVTLSGDKCCIAKKILGTITGVAAAPIGAFVNANAGGAYGAVEGGGIKDEKIRDLAWRNLLGVGLMVTGGLLAGGTGALLGLFGGIFAWNGQGDEIRGKVATDATQAVHQHVGEPNNDRSTAKKIIDGICGGAVGFVQGGITGGEAWYKGGQKLGEKIADKLFGK